MLWCHGPGRGDAGILDDGTRAIVEETVAAASRAGQRCNRDDTEKHDTAWMAVLCRSF